MHADAAQQGLDNKAAGVTQEVNNAGFSVTVQESQQWTFISTGAELHLR